MILICWNLRWDGDILRKEKTRVVGIIETHAYTKNGTVKTR